MIAGKKKRSSGSRPRPKPSPTMTFQANVVKVGACLIDYVGDRGYQRQLREYSLVPKEYVVWGQRQYFPPCLVPSKLPHPRERPVCTWGCTHHLGHISPRRPLAGGQRRVCSPSETGILKPPGGGYVVTAAVVVNIGAIDAIVLGRGNAPSFARKRCRLYPAFLFSPHKK